jgi:hypothetical protein
MRSRVFKRSLGAILLLLATTLSGWFYLSWGREHPQWAYPSGWLLMAVMLFLTFYNARKKLPFLNLLSSRVWLQLHIYLGFFSVIAFLFHVCFRWPSGWFEVVLTWLFAIVAISGFVGLVLSRDFPKRLTARGGEVLYERIPLVRRRLHDEAEALALGSVESARSSTVADFYAATLHSYFIGHRHFLLHCLAREGPLTRLLGKISEQDRYLNDEERQVMASLRELVIQKNGLDYHYALQTALRLWLFFHIPFTYSLILWSIAHVLLVHGFAAGAGR